MPLVFSDGETNVITFVADRPGGFTDVELGETRDVVRVLARLLAIEPHSQARVRIPAERIRLYRDES